MANSFINTSLVATDASVMLANNIVMPQLCNRQHEDLYRSRVGDTIEIKVSPLQTARDLADDVTTTASDITDTSVDLTLDSQPYVKHVLTTKEKTLEVEDFNFQVVRPAVLAIATAIDKQFLDVAAAGFAPNYANGEGTNPSTIAHILQADKVLNENLAPVQDRVAVIGVDAQASFLALDNFTSGDYAPSTKALNDAQISRRYGFDFYMDQQVGTITIGDTDEATNLAANVASGASTMTVDKAGAASGTIGRGSRFTIAGDTQVYTVTADTDSASDVFVLPVSPVAAQASADNAAITWKTASKQNIFYCKNALAGAIVAPLPMSGDSSVAIYNGIGIRVSMVPDASTMADTIVFDTLSGAQVTQVDGGCLCGGA